MRIILGFHKFLENLKGLDFLGIFTLRIYIFYVFWFAGIEKIENFDKFSNWLGSLGLPFTEFFTWMVLISEAGGAALLLVGLFVRWACIPMIITMIVVYYH